LSTLLSVSDARQRLISKFSPLEPEVVNLEDAHGRILADAIVSPYDYPLFDNSSMDGFAVRAEDIISASEKSPVTLIVVADLPAGQATSISLENQQAIRIMTGAPLPKGADAVVPVENTDQYRTSKQTLGDFPTSVIIYHPVNSGDYIRPRGQDINAGDKVLSPGATLRAQEVGFLAMLGIGRVPVYRRPRVAILSTGDELLPLETPLQPGKIHDSNAYTLAGQIERDGGEAIKLGIVKDDAFLIKKILDRALFRSPGGRDKW
jgi:molybdopterin molybdotransferase